MNRIVLIGNGFDLAHNLKTSYRHFIDDFWVGIANHIANNKGMFYIDGTIGIEVSGIKITHPGHTSLYDFNKIKTANAFFALLNECPWISFELNNRFLGVISRLFTTEKWVDIEEEYYKQLRQLALDAKGADIDAICKLNQDFTEVENLLCAYLAKTLSGETNTIASIQKICDNSLKINLDEFSITYYRQVKEILKQCFEVGEEYDVRKMIELIRSTNILEPTKMPSEMDYYSGYSYETFNFETVVANFRVKHKIQNTLFLNFNYTQTPQQYAGIGNRAKIINIHGTLNDEKNPIIFGYGDEAGDDYAKLENTNVDEVLKKVKSQHYLLNRNYRELTNFMESDVFQVIILGHSCGNSDRTLLKALFEHENCVSIKPYYYTEEGKTDNYGDIIRAISRNFSDKTLMRSKSCRQNPLFGYTWSRIIDF